LKVSEEADETGISALFLIELSDFFDVQHADRSQASAGQGSKRRRYD
jgi:hypothetical protein